MLLVRGSAVFLKKLRPGTKGDPVPPDTTALGEWYAHATTIQRRHAVLFVNAHSLLAVIVEAAPKAGLMDRFRSHLARLLFHIGVPEADIEREINATSDVAFAKATNRSVIGTINRMLVEVPIHERAIQAHAGVTAGYPELEDRFAKEIWGATGYRSPTDIIREHFALTPVDSATPPAVPPGRIIVERMHGLDWEFRFPRIGAPEHERFFDAIDSFSRNPVHARREVEQLVRGFPEFIAAIDELARMSDALGERARALDLWRHAVGIGTAAIPAGFKMGRDRLPWSSLDNRPFLRAACFLAMHYDDTGHPGEAEPLYEMMLALNPDDNQGARSLLVDLRLKTGDDAGALAVCDEYADDPMPSILYGRVLVLFRLGRLEGASAALETAFEVRPLVARLIASDTRRRPQGLDPVFITVNSEDEAWSYWEGAGRAWLESPKAIRLVADFVGRQKPMKESPMRKGKVVPFPRRDKR